MPHCIRHHKSHRFDGSAQSDSHPSLHILSYTGMTGSDRARQTSMDFSMWTKTLSVDALGQGCCVSIHFWMARSTTRKTDNGKLMQQLSLVMSFWDQGIRSTVISLKLLKGWEYLGNYCCKKKLNETTFQKKILIVYIPVAIAKAEEIIS